MQFNAVANKNGIIQGIEIESGLGLTTISGNASPDYYLDYFTMKINEWLHIVTHWIHQVNDEWTYDDANHGDFAEETYDFTDSRQDYGLDSDITAVYEIQAHDATKTEPEGWYTLDLQVKKDRTDDYLAGSDGKPSGYWFDGRSFTLDVPVDIAKVDKYRIIYDRHAHEFTTSDTTAVPGFDKQFHWILVYGPLMDWADRRIPDVYNKCFAKIFGAGEGDPNALKTMLQQHYIQQLMKNKSYRRKVGRAFNSYE